MKTYRSMPLIVAIVAAVLSLAIPVFAGPNTNVNHQPWSGLKPNQEGADTYPNDQGGTTVTQTTSESSTEGNTTTTTTVTKTNATSGDGTETDSVVTVKETSETATDPGGGTYVKSQTTETTTTMKTVYPDKTFTKKTTHAVGHVEKGEPDEHGQSPTGAGSIVSEPTVTKFTDKKGNETTSYTDNDGTYHEYTEHPDGTSTSLFGSSGSYTEVNTHKDGSETVTDYSGKNKDGSRRVKKVTEYDQDREVTKETEYDKDGRYTVNEYPGDKKDEYGTIGRVKTDYFQDGSIVERKVYYENGGYYIIRYIGNHPIRIDYFDEDDKLYETEKVPMEEWDDPKYAFGDGLGIGGPGSGALGRDVGFGGEVAMGDAGHGPECDKGMG